MPVHTTTPEDAIATLRDADLAALPSTKLRSALNAILMAGHVGLVEEAIALWKPHATALATMPFTRSVNPNTNARTTPHAPGPVWQGAPHPSVGRLFLLTSMRHPYDGFWALKEHLSLSSTLGACQKSMLLSILMVDEAWIQPSDDTMLVHLMHNALRANVVRMPLSVQAALFARLLALRDLDTIIARANVGVRLAEHTVITLHSHAHVSTLVRMIQRKGVQGGDVRSVHACLSFIQRLPSPEGFQHLFHQPDGDSLARQAVMDAANNAPFRPRVHAALATHQR